MRRVKRELGRVSTLALPPDCFSVSPRFVGPDYPFGRSKNCQQFLPVFCPGFQAVAMKPALLALGSAGMHFLARKQLKFLHQGVLLTLRQSRLGGQEVIDPLIDRKLLRASHSLRHLRIPKQSWTGPSRKLLGEPVRTATPAWVRSKAGEINSGGMTIGYWL